MKILKSYKRITKNKVTKAEHTLIFERIHGYSPIAVDHIDGNIHNNSPENLRECTKSQNGMNRGKPANNTSGYKGVSYNKSKHSWEAYINFEKRRIHLGTFSTKEEAAIAYNQVALKYHKEFAKLNEVGS